MANEPRAPLSRGAAPHRDLTAIVNANVNVSVHGGPVMVDALVLASRSTSAERPRAAISGE